MGVILSKCDLQDVQHVNKPSPLSANKLLPTSELLPALQRHEEKPEIKRKSEKLKIEIESTTNTLPKQQGKDVYCGTDELKKSDISYLKTSQAFDVAIHSRALLAAILF